MQAPVGGVVDNPQKPAAMFGGADELIIQNQITLSKQLTQIMNAVNTVTPTVDEIAVKDGV
jgi:hypothetical protein